MLNQVLRKFSENTDFIPLAERQRGARNPGDFLAVTGADFASVMLLE